MKNKNLLKLSTLVLSTLLLVGCGNNSGGGSSSKKDDSSKEKTYYTVTFMNGEEVFATAQAEANDVVAKPATDPTKEGFEFTGWFTAAEAGEKWIFETDVVKSDMSLFAQYEANQVDYTVNFLLNGEVAATKTTDSKGQADVLLSAIALDEGKSLLGWGVDAGTTAADVDYRVGSKLSYAQVVELANENHVVNLHAIVKDGDILRLNVGAWGRYVDEAFMQRVMTAFKAEAAEQSLAYDFLDYTYFADEGYHAVADFAAGILADTSIGVVFPSGSNFKDQTGVAAVMKDHAAAGTIVLDDETVVTGRYATRLSDNNLDKAFYTWILSDEGKTVCDPSYVAPTTHGEPSATKFVLGVWGRWYTEADSNALVEAFKTYATAQGVSYEEATVVYLKGSANTDPYYSKANYLEEVANDLSLDVMFPVTADIATGVDSGLSDELKAKITTSLNLGEGDDGLGLTIGGKTDRYLATLNADAITAAFVAFCQTEEGKKALDSTYGQEEPEEETEAQKTLVLSYYAKFVSDSTTTGYSVLTNAFKTYIASDTTLSSYTVVDEYTGADLNNENFAKQIRTDADVVLFGASALTSKLTAAGFTVADTENIGTKLGTTTERVYHALNTDKITKAFTTWLLSEQGQAVVATLTAPAA